MSSEYIVHIKNSIDIDIHINIIRSSCTISYVHNNGNFYNTIYTHSFFSIHFLFCFHTITFNRNCIHLKVILKHSLVCLQNREMYACDICMYFFDGLNDI